MLLVPALLAFGCQTPTRGGDLDGAERPASPAVAAAARADSWTVPPQPPARVALQVEADPATLSELRDGLAAAGVRVVEAPRARDGGSQLLWNADYLLTGTLPTHLPDAAAPARYQLAARLVRDATEGLVKEGKLSSAGAGLVGRELARSIDSHWRGLAGKGVLFSVVGEQLPYSAVRRIEQALVSTGRALRARTFRFEQGVASFDIWIPAHLSAEQLAQGLEGMPVGDARARVLRVTDQAVHLTLSNPEPPAP